MIMKKCQIHAVSPITCFTVPIVGSTQLNLTHDEIYQCLCAKAEVLEILGNGKTINLDFTNYNRDNSIIGEPVEKVEEIVTEEHPEPVIEVEEEPEVIEEVAEEEVTLDLAETEETVFVTGMSVLEDEESEVEDAETVFTPAEPVKEMKVESRNNNYKNNNNKKNKKK